ncbi:MAG: HAD-IA family hydrolase [Bacteroidetes bacterium]|jgi:HAD superfamily hydrolase (TIGR01549 family)|nr:HAD-IA family hydrolase [Bacteroidota bacterium]
MPAIRFVYFDLDDTLLDHRAAERAGLGDVLEAHGAHFDGVTLDRLHEVYHGHSTPLWEQYSHDEISKETLQHQRFARTLETLGISTLDPDALNRYYLRRYARHWTLPESARAAFHAAADHHPVGILTNGFAEVQRAKFERFPELRERARAVIISEDVGVMKPHPRLFAHAADRADAQPEQILYVGDSYTSDVLGARQAGWQVAWYRANGHTDDQRARADDAYCFDHWPTFSDWLLGDENESA